MKKIKKAILPVFFVFTMAIIAVVIAACAAPSDQNERGSQNNADETRIIVGMYATPSGGNARTILNALGIDVADIAVCLCEN